MKPSFLEYAEEIMRDRVEYDLLLERLVISMAPAYFSEGLSAEAIVQGAISLREELYGVAESYQQNYPRTKPTSTNAITQN
jgi:hypothetical protein